MPEPLVVEIELKGVDEATGGLSDVAKATKASAAASKAQSQAATAAARALAAQISAQRQQILLQSASVRLQQQQVRLAQSLQKSVKPTPAQVQTQAARAAASQVNAQRQAVLLQSAQVRLQQQQMRYNQALIKQNTLKPAAPAAPSFLQKAMSAVMSSRVSMGAGGVQLMPLVNRILPLLGTEATLAAAGIGLMVSAAKQAADTLTSFRDAMLTSGGTTGETARLVALGGAIGLSDADMAKMARSFSDSISQGGVGAGYASKAGVYDIGIFGDTDKARNLLKWADALQQMSDSEAKRAARATGTEELLKERDLSAGTRRELDIDKRVREKIFTPEQTRQAAEFNAQLDRFEGSLMNVVTVIGTPVLRLISNVMDGAADFFNLFAVGLRTIFDYLAKIPILGKAFTGQDERDSALNKNTNALKEATAAMKAGIYGGGERARGTMPGRLNGFNAHQYIGQPIAYGALGL